MSERNEHGFEIQSDRVEKINAANLKSFLVDDNEGETSHKVVQSLHSIGVDRKLLSPKYAQAFDRDVVKAAALIGRTEVNGNVSPLGGYGPKVYSPESRIEDAKENIHSFLYHADVDPADVRMLRPERDYTTPLSVINIDEIGLEPDDTGLSRPIADGAGDFLYSHNPDVVLAARPADCPIVFITAETPTGPAKVLLHLAWKGVAHGYVDQAKEALDGIEVDWDTVRIQVTPGGQAASFKFENFSDYNPLEAFPESASMFDGVTEVGEKDGKPAYDFAIDLTPQVYEEITQKWDIDPYQIFVDTTDTTASNVGYSSHSRSFAGFENIGSENSRDLVMLIPPFRFPEQNPDKPAPIEVLENIKPIRVRYVDFKGELQTATIEVHKDLAEDVKGFFEEAVKLEFPIQHVVKSSDEAYGWDDDKLMADNATTAFNYRLIKGTEKPSLHGLGRALDVNDALNPYVRYVDGGSETDPPGSIYDPQIPGTLTADHPLVTFMKKRGWEWGGDWTPESGRTDYQHFQKAE